MSFTQRIKSKSSSRGSSRVDALHPYQRTVVQNLIKKPRHGILLRPGLGKTRIALETFVRLRKSGKVGSVLTLAPLRPCYRVWPVEVGKWQYDISNVILHGRNREAALDEDVDMYVLNYEGLPWFYEAMREDPTLCPDMLIVDESAKIRNPGTQRFHYLRILNMLFERVVLMTGTPIPNGYMNLWSQQWMLDGGKALGQTLSIYRQRWFHKRKYGQFKKWEHDRGAPAEIQKAVKSTWTHIPDNVLKLPPLKHNPIMTELSKKDRKLYDQMHEEMLIELEDAKIPANHMGVVTQKCRQIANGFVYDQGKKPHFLHDNKLEAVRDLVEESGEPTIVAYEFTADGGRLQEYLRKHDIDAHMVSSAKKDADIITQWEAGKLHVLLSQATKIAEGLNLQSGGRHMVLYGMIWDLYIYDQLIKRLWRQGQKKTVMLHHVLAYHTVDETMLKAVDGKVKTQSQFLTALQADGRW